MLFNQQILLLASLLSLALQAIAIKPADIQIELNANMWQKKKIVFDSILEIKGVQNWPDGDIVDLAYTAHIAMEAEYNKLASELGTNTKWDPWKVPPNVVTVLVTEDHAFIASSMKGGSVLYDKFVPSPPNNHKTFYKGLKADSLCPARIIEGLKQCEATAMTGDTVGHKNGGSCGEVMAAWALCDGIGEAHLDKGKVVAVTKVKKGGEAREIIDPCSEDLGTNPLKGCRKFNQHFKWTVIPKGTRQGKAPAAIPGMKVTHATYAVEPVKKVRRAYIQWEA